MGSCILEDQRLRSLPDLALAERTRMGETPNAEGRRRLRGPGQRLPILRRSGVPPAALRPARRRCRARFLLAVVLAPALAFHQGGSRRWLRLRTGLPAVRGVGDGNLRST